MNSILFTDDQGEPAALVLNGFVHRGHFYGQAKTSRGWHEVCIPLKTYIELLNK